MQIPDRMIQNKRDAILLIAHRHGAKNVRVFGSRARGDARADSDLDLLVEAGSNISPFFPGGLLMDLEELLGCKVHVTEPDALHHDIHEQVLKESVPL